MFDCTGNTLEIGDWVWKATSSKRTPQIHLGQITHIRVATRTQGMMPDPNGGVRWVVNPDRVHGKIKVTAISATFGLHYSCHPDDDPLRTAVCLQLLRATPEQIIQWRNHVNT